MKLDTAIQPGFRRPFVVTPDHPIEGPLRVEVLSGDSTVTLNDDGVSGFLNGDGALGEKVIEFIADGHVGPGEVEIRVRIEYAVAHPDATSLGISFGADEPIPA